MTHTSPHITLQRSLIALALTMGTLVFLSAATRSFATSVPAGVKPEKKIVASTIEKRADRMIQRLHGSAVDISTDEYVKALEQRSALMARSVTVQIVDQYGNASGSLVLSVQDNPTWLLLDTEKPAKTIIDRNRVKATVADRLTSMIDMPAHCVITDVNRKVPGTEGYDKIETQNCFVKNGQTFNIETLTDDVMKALDQDVPSTVIVRVEPVKGIFINQTREYFGQLQLLASGKSNIKGSIDARKKNVYKAINEKLNGLIIPAGETFAFNSTLGGRVTTGNGWHMALGIFEGGALRMTPGGGICQSSTTMYRSALYAGLPIVEQASHSIYVSYYEMYGVGQDATIFPGSQDLKFINDTGAPIIVQAYIEGENVTINFYGTPDGRTVTMEGPYFAATAPSWITVHNRAVKSNEIVWIRRIIKANGETVQEQFVSRYNKGIPNSVAKKYTTNYVVEEKTVNVSHR